jgi:hypothetical protein
MRGNASSTPAVAGINTSHSLDISLTCTEYASAALQRKSVVLHANDN